MYFIFYWLREYLNRNIRSSASDNKVYVLDIVELKVTHTKYSMRLAIFIPLNLQHINYMESYNMISTSGIRSTIKEHPWDRARHRLLKRRNVLSQKLQSLDRGVNYFVLQLERMGIRTEWSCEGHPAGFYISAMAANIRDASG